MEKSSKKIDKITQEIIRSGGLHRPSNDFVENVMKAVSAIESNRFTYTPLIPKKGWVILFLTFLVLLVYIFFFSDTDFTLIGNILLFEKIAAIDLKLPEIKLSKELIYGIGFLGLFLLQIPFLKRQLDSVKY